MACPECEEKRKTQLHWKCGACGDGCSCYNKQPAKKKGREARYKAMSEESLRNQVGRFTRELQEKEMYLFEREFKTNSLLCVMMELHRRGLFVEPVIISTQKKKPDFHLFTHEIDAKKIEGHVLNLLGREDCPLCEAGIPTRKVKQ